MNAADVAGVGGSAWYGLESFGHDYIDFPQIDDGRYGAIYVGPTGPTGRVATRIFGAFMDCEGKKSVPPPSVDVTTGSFSVGSIFVSGVGSTAGIAVGDPINSPNLALNTTVAAFTSNTITLSRPATASATGTLTVSHGYQGIELFPGSLDVTVAGTSTANNCGMAANQIVTQDGQADPSTQILGPSYGNYATVFGTQANATATTVTTNASTYIIQPTIYHVCADPNFGTVGVQLPTWRAVGVTYSVDDCTGHAAAHNVTVSPPPGSGLSIDGAPSYVISSNYGSWSGYWTGGLIWKTTAHQP